MIQSGRPSGVTRLGAIGGRSALWGRAILIAGLILCGACTDPAAGLRVRMTEKEVIVLLGRPSRDVSDSRSRDFYLGDNKECAEKAVRVLVFDRLVREDVFVGLDSSAKALCISRAKVFIIN